MSNKDVKCPYCNAVIDESVEICPQCGENFKEIDIPLKIDSLGKFIFYNVITVGLFQYLWLIFNLKNINEMIIKEKDKYKLNIPIITLGIIMLLAIFNIILFKSYMIFDIPEPMVTFHLILCIAIGPILVIGGGILTYFITYRILRIIERYTKYKYKKELTHSELGWLFCPVIFAPILSPMFYMAYFIYTYKERAYNPKPISM